MNIVTYYSALNMKFNMWRGDVCDQDIYEIAVLWNRYTTWKLEFPNMHTLKSIFLLWLLIIKTKRKRSRLTSSDRCFPHFGSGFPTRGGGTRSGWANMAGSVLVKSKFILNFSFRILPQQREITGSVQVNFNLFCLTLLSLNIVGSVLIKSKFILPFFFIIFWLIC